MTGRPTRPIPADFIAFAATMTHDEMAKHYKCGRGTVAKWVRASGAPPRPRSSHARRPIPTDFLERSAEMTVRQLCKHYQASESTILRFRRESGIAQIERRAREKRREEVYKAKEKRRAQPSIDVGKVCYAPLPLPPRDTSRLGDAADFLRRDGWRVCRAVTVRPAASKDEWLVGRLALRTEEMIAMAERKGWRHVNTLEQGYGV